MFGTVKTDGTVETVPYGDAVGSVQGAGRYTRRLYLYIIRIT